MSPVETFVPKITARKIHVAVDIGSTVIKIARLDDDSKLQEQDFFLRDLKAGIAAQVHLLLGQLGLDADDEGVAVCSSANGGLRVGIVCLTEQFSGAGLRNQVLLAGANPVFVREFDEPGGDLRRVDMLLVGGGIDAGNAAPIARRLEAFDPAQYNFGTLAYAATSQLARRFVERFPSSVMIGNPLGSDLSSRVGTVFEAVRRAYLDDLVFKEGVTQLRANLARGIRPTPEVVSQGFLRAVMKQSELVVVGACLALDIGGATTDLHYVVELVREDSEIKPAGGSSVARHVFTDLGIVSSRETVILQLRQHTKLYQFLNAVFGVDVRETYSLLREGDYQPAEELLSYACLFLALERFSSGSGPGLPAADLRGLSQIILTGGAVQVLDEAVVLRVAALLMPQESGLPLIQIDRRYGLWVDGITWSSGAPLFTAAHQTSAPAPATA